MPFIPPFGSAPGASKALDNLASVAINTSLISDTDSTDDLGSSSIAWANLWVDNIKSTDGTDLLIFIDTTDASDDARIRLSGGGGFGSTRGAFVGISGNEEARPGRLVLAAGNTGYVSISDNNSLNYRFVDGAFHPQTDSVSTLGKSDKFWKDLYVDNIVGPTTFNSAAADVDFTFSGDNVASLLFIDASEDEVLVNGRNLLRYSYLTT